MKEKLEVYNKINSKNYLRFELNEGNEKEYLNKLISVKEALNEVEKKNNEAYYNKISKIECFKEGVKDYYNYSEDLDKAVEALKEDFDLYYENYMKPLNALVTRREKLRMQVVPYITNGFWQKFKAIFSYEGRAKLNIEKQFNKELKDVEKEIKNTENLKANNPLTFENREDKEFVDILNNIDLTIVNQNLVLSNDQINEFKYSISISKEIAQKGFKLNVLKKVDDLIEVCSDYVQIADLNIDEHYKFKNTEFKIYLQNGYIDNDLNSIKKYLELTKSENDFVGKQAAKKLIDGIQECIYELECLINSDNNEKLA